MLDTLTSLNWAPTTINRGEHVGKFHIHVCVRVRVENIFHKLA